MVRKTKTTRISDDFVNKIIQTYGKEEILKTLTGDNGYVKYQNDPVGFIKDVLGVKNLPQNIAAIAESVRDNRVTIAQSCTGAGKTFCSSALALWMYKCFPGSQVIMTAAPPELNLKEKLWGELSDLILRNKKVFKNDKKNALRISDQIDFDKEIEDGESSKHAIFGRVIPAAGDKEARKASFSGFHAPYQLFILDEADAIPDEIFIAIEGCMSGSFARLLCTFNPKRKSGEVYQRIKNGNANVIVLSAFDHPNVITGEDIIPNGPVSRQQTVCRIHDWTEPIREGEEIDTSCFKVPDFLVGCVVEDDAGNKKQPLPGGWRKIHQPQFSYIVLGQYPPQGASQLINETWIDRAVMRWEAYVAANGKNVSNNIKPMIGVDVADEGIDFCCACVKYGGFVKEFVRWRGIDTDLSATKIASLYSDVDAFVALVESDGIGAAIPPKLSRDWYWYCESCNKTFYDNKIFQCPTCQKDLIRKVFNSKKLYVSQPSEKKCSMGKFDKMRDQLWWAVREWLEKDPGAMLPDIKDLREELLAPDFYENVSNGRLKVTDKKELRKRLGRSPDYADSLIMTFWDQSAPRIRLLN